MQQRNGSTIKGVIAISLITGLYLLTAWAMLRGLGLDGLAGAAAPAGGGAPRGGSAAGASGGGQAISRDSAALATSPMRIRNSVPISAE